MCRTRAAPHLSKLRLRKPERTGAALFIICKNQLMPGKKPQMQPHGPDIRKIAIWRKRDTQSPSKMTAADGRNIPSLFLVCLQCAVAAQSQPGQGSRQSSGNTPSPQCPPPSDPPPALERSGRFLAFVRSPSCLFGSVT